MNANYISVAEFQAAHPEVDLSPYTTATVSGFISDASRMVDDYCSVDGFDYEVVVGEKQDALISNRGDLIVFPRKRPVSSVQSIVLKQGLTSLTLTLTQSGSDLFEIPTDGSRIVYPDSTFIATGTFTVRSLLELRSLRFFAVVGYGGGYQTIPRSIKQATMLFVRDIMSKRLNPTGAASVTQGGISIKYAERDGMSDDVLDAQRLLDPYVRVVPL